MWGLLMILTRYPEEGLPQIFLKIKRSQDLGPSWKNAESAKMKNGNLNARPMMWGILMILTRYPEERLPQIFLKIKRSQDLGPSWQNAESAKNEKQKYWCQPYDVGSFNDPHTISWGEATSNFPQNEAFSRSRPILKKTQSQQKMKNRNIDASPMMWVF